MAYNENQNPNLGESTILMFKDIYRYGKRMGRADYWWGMLGIAILTFVDILVYSLIPETWLGDCLCSGIALVLFLAYLSATARRLRDVGYSGWLTLMAIIPYCIGSVILLFFTIKPSKQEDNAYLEDTQSSTGKFFTQSKNMIFGTLAAIALLFGAVYAASNYSNDGSKGSNYSSTTSTGDDDLNDTSSDEDDDDDYDYDDDDDESSSSSESSSSEESDEEDESSSSSEIEESYDPNITWDELARNPKNHEGDNIQISGSVMQVDEDSKVLLVEMNGDVDQLVQVDLNSSNSNNRILEGDYVTVKGMYFGVTSYTTVMGDKNTVPEIDASDVSR